MASTCAPLTFAFASSSFIDSPGSALDVWVDDDCDQRQKRASRNLMPAAPVSCFPAPPGCARHPAFLFSDADKENVDPRGVLSDLRAVPRPRSLTKPLQDITLTFESVQATNLRRKPRRGAIVTVQMDQTTDLRHKLRNGVTGTEGKDQGLQCQGYSGFASSGSKKMFREGRISPVRSQELRKRFR